MASNSAGGSLLGKIAAYIEILAKDPRSTVFVPLAEAYRQMGLLDDALEIATRGVQTHSAFCPGYTVLGRIQAQRGELSAAAGAFEKALLIEPQNLTALKGLAKVRMHQGDRGRALTLVQRAVSLSPDDAAAQKMLAALAASPPTPAAVVPTKPAGSAEPAAAPVDEPISTATIAEIYIRQGFFNRALKVYRDLLAADPHNDEIRQKLVALKRRIESQEASAGVKKQADQEAPQASPAPPEPEPEKQPEAAPTEMEDAPRQLEALTLWLDSISRRRAHVR